MFIDPATFGAGELRRKFLQWVLQGVTNRRKR
jgi:hypothetical protein